MPRVTHARFLVLLGMTIAFAANAAAQARPIGITHVTVLDLEQGKRLRDQTVVIEAERISTIGPSSQVRVPDGYGVVDGRGKFIIPGFIASIAPIENVRSLSAFLGNGITTVVASSERTRGKPNPMRPLGGASPEPRITVSDERGSTIGVVTAASIHDSLEALVRRGTNPERVLRSVTVDAARTLGLERELGAVAVGRLADFLVLDDNPLADIRHTRRISAVAMNGRFIDASELARLAATRP
jgi:imidazolonepropionase-like amidohydrolase